VTVIRRFEALIGEAQEQPFSGWDFSWLGDRMTAHPLPWDYGALVADRARHSPDLLDLGTGGGERLAALPHHPPLTVATESWPPNVPVAARLLHPLGIHVVRVEGAPDNVDQPVAGALRGRLTGTLPFRDGAFHLVVSRHTAYLPGEVARVLVAGGRFLTQQVGYGLEAAFHRLLDLPVPAEPVRRLTLAFASEQMRAAGLAVVDGAEAVQRYEFFDVGAVVWYLKATPWTVPGFSVEACRSRLVWLHEHLFAEGPVFVGHASFWLEAARPD
jgi:hypothetical protein